MALEAHLESLNHRHEELDTALSQEVKNPNQDDLRIAQLKRQKLRIKDEIEDIRHRMIAN